MGWEGTGEDAFEDEPMVCIAHGRFIPCRSDEDHHYTTRADWVEMVRDFQNGVIVVHPWDLR